MSRNLRERALAAVAQLGTPQGRRTFQVLRRVQQALDRNVEPKSRDVAELEALMG